MGLFLKNGKMCKVTTVAKNYYATYTNRAYSTSFGLILLLLSTFTWTTTAFAQQNLTWNFPINRPHAGLLLGNGTQGLMVWGSGSQLIITVGRAGFWDHRGGNDFATRITYAELEKLLQAGDEAAIKRAFAVPTTVGSPNLGHPQQIGGGRIVLDLPVGWTLRQGVGHLREGVLSVTATQDSDSATLTIRQHPTQELAWIDLPEALQATRVSAVPSWNFVKDQLAPVGVAPPETWSETAAGGFVQTLPDDIPLALAYRRIDQNVFIASSVHSEARAQVERLLVTTTPEQLDADASDWWATYWTNAPRAALPNAGLQEIFDYGLYKLACVTPPQGVACTLQGPFMESYQLPPWSNDYHLNINLEMIYYPLLMSGKFDHFQPLWLMLKSWWPEIEKNGRQFFQNERALMLPHAVDDRAKVVGTFWTGTIDQACTAWMAQLAWLHYRYAGDKAVLQEIAYPLLVGAFEGYYAMLEPTDSGYVLPVSVSPEYRGSRMDAWGKNASFQLAALHAMCDILPQAARVLSKSVDPRWAEVEAKLPLYTTVEGVYQQEFQLSNERIALWEGMDLIESHRHHSHLGGIWPFATYDPLSDAHKQVVDESLKTWVYRGAGGWSGWCVPWAAMLMARTNQSEASVNWLTYWKTNFVNEGRGTLHNANTHGQSLLGSDVYAKKDSINQIDEVMQLDAGFGALTAVYELLLQNRIDGLHVLPGLHAAWDDLSFTNVWAEGGFRMSAIVEQQRVVEVVVEATRADSLRLHHNLGETWTLDGEPHSETVLRKQCEAGERLVLRRK